MVRRFCIAALSCLLFSQTSSAMQWGEMGNAPVHDDHWPAGSVEVANLPARIGWVGGDGGWSHFMYVGDSAALQATVDAFARIRAPQSSIVLQSGPHTATLIGDRAAGPQERAVDWEFVVYDSDSWFRWHSLSMMTMIEGLELGKPPAPRLNVYLKGQIDWAQIKVPDNITVSDERADANGIASGPAVRGDVFDYVSSKPIASAQLKIEKIQLVERKQTFEQIATGQADASGRFQISGFPTGTLRVTVSADGYAPRVVGYYEEFQANTLKKYTSYLSPAESVSGVVTDTNDKPLAKVDVEGLRFVGPDATSYRLPDEMVRAQTDEQGRFVLSGLPRGVATIRARGDGLYQLDSMTPHQIPAKDLALRMIATGVLRGKVSGGDGRRGPPRINVRPPGDPVGKWGGSAMVKPDGTFEFKNVPPGEYMVSANPLIPGLPDDPNAKRVQVKSGETTEVEIER